MKFRHDIQGLRALAVLLVICGHAFPGVFPGGFIGVDIFFVISGYLITRILIKDSTNGLIKYLQDFYARRVKRILPAALLVILASTLGAYRILGVIVGSDTARDGLWSTYFLANWHFNSLAINYFDSALPAPILQHYWSLAIEEQFYLIWPLILYLLVKQNRSPLMGISAITSLSLGLSLMNNGSTTSYFSSLTRFWELGAGAIFALVKLNYPKRLFSFLGLSIIAFLAFEYNQNTPFPGFFTLPVVGATILIIATSQTNELLKSKWMTYIGDLSYILYLWHWPVLQIARLDGRSSTADMWGCLALTFLLSAATHHAFENPLRYSSVSSKGALLFGGAGLTLTSLSLLALRSWI